MMYKPSRKLSARHRKGPRVETRMALAFKRVFPDAKHLGDGGLLQKPLLGTRSRTYNVRSQLGDELVRGFHEFVKCVPDNSRLKVAVLDCLERGDWDKYLTLEANPGDYEDPWTYRVDYQLVSALKKADFLITSHDRRETAIKKWCDAERLCASTNDRLDELVYGTKPDPEQLAMLQRMRDFIARVLGPAPRLADLKPKFGPGSTALVKRDITPQKKYGKKICCTPLLVPYVHQVIGPHWGPHTLIVVDGNTLSFVPKNAKTDRAICVEPDLNVYLQLGIGNLIRSRLRPWVDLDRGQERNRQLAKLAYKLGLATIDLSSASDTVARGLVFHLIPEDWYDLLDLTRSHTVTFKGQTMVTEKFSSMGNGFTFELETLIFFAACVASGVNREHLAVYGDDIIVPQHQAESVIENLALLGFQVNKDKSFTSGSFFESCGHDYFQGINVRPFAWKHAENPTDILKAINDISRFAHHKMVEPSQPRPVERKSVPRCAAADAQDRNLILPGWGFRDSSYRPAYEVLLKVAQQNGWAHPVPAHFGDVGVITDFDEALPAIRRTGDGNFTCKVVKFVAQTTRYDRSFNGYLYMLDAGQYEDVVITSPRPSAIARPVPIRGRGKYELRRQTTPLWCWSGLGPWV